MTSEDAPAIWMLRDSPKGDTIEIFEEALLEPREYGAIDIHEPHDDDPPSLLCRRSWWLSDDYHWRLVRDSDDCLVLVAIKKDSDDDEPDTD